MLSVRKFDRTLCDGAPSERAYGALIAAHLVRDEGFRRVLGSYFHDAPLPPAHARAKRSRYNAFERRLCCAVCGDVKLRPTDQDLHVHHLQHQALADCEGFLPDGSHKDLSSNTIAVCAPYHRDIHAGAVHVEVRDTLVGREIVVSHVISGDAS